MDGSRLFEDPTTGDKIYEPARNDDRVNTHNRTILQLWRANVDWQPVLSRHAVMNYIAKYAAKAEKSSETYHQMLVRLANIENPNEAASKAYKRLLTETLIERDIGAQETCHMLLELPLVESSRVFVTLNVSREVFKPVIKNEENDDEAHLKLFIEGYMDRPYAMESVTLIDAARSWTYNSRRK